MASLGDAYKCLLPPYHVFIIISEPDDDGNAVIVSLTTHPAEWDPACELVPADYPTYVKQKCVVYYDKAVHSAVINLEDTNNFQKIASPPLGTLERIRKGALKSDYLVERLRLIIKAELF